MNEEIKKPIGWVLWCLSKRSRLLRALLCPLGMRTKKEWFKNQTGTVYLASNRRVKVTNIDKSYLTFTLFWRGWSYYEPVTILLLRELLRNKDVFFDIGANVGYYSLCAASERKGLHVVAFEPNPRVYPTLSANVKVNGFDILCEQAAVSDRMGTGKFMVHESDQAGSLEKDTFKIVNPTHPIDVVSVPTVGLDDYIRNRKLHGRFLMKVDVEGHEASVLRGAANTLRDCQPEMILEVIRNYDAKIVNLLKDCNYRFYEITNMGFHESDNLIFHKRPDFLFLNYLVTTRGREEVNGMFNALRDKINALDLKKTSLYRPCARNA